MLKKVKFPEYGCWECPSYSVQGKFPCETRYCMAKSKKGKRFKNSDPKYKPPKWCPRRLPARICRVYRLREEARELEFLRREDTDLKKLTYFSAQGFHYDPEPKLEQEISLTAKQFYQKANEDGAEGILDTDDLEPGDLFEIDDGLKSYFFYYFSFATILPSSVFGLERKRENSSGTS